MGAVLWLTEHHEAAAAALSEADLVANGTAAALAFDDPHTAWETLRMFRAEPEVAAAAVYNASGALFAGYMRDGSPLPVPDPLPKALDTLPAEGVTRFVSGRVLALHPVRVKGQVLGAVAVVADLSAAHRELWVMVRAALAAVAASLLLAGALSVRLQRLVSGPILELADLTGRVSRERTFALRAPVRGGDELGLLARGFNAMLAEIQSRDEALGRHRQDLERTVDERTRELGRANARLTNELAERRRAEGLVRGQNEALESLATGRPLGDTLALLCRFLEGQLAGARCAVMAHVPEAGRMRHLAAPHLPPEYVAALDAWPAGPGGFPVPLKPDRLEPLWTSSIAESPLWQAVGPLALAHGLRACWCMPVRSPEGEVLGRICLYHGAPTPEPTDAQRRLLESAAAIAGMALERERAEVRLAHMAHFDGLTGLPNRRLFNDRLTQALGRARRRKGRVAVLFADLDRFKPVNDSLGHHAGDRVLKEVSDRVKGVLRQEDTLARLGGDEFTVILEDIIGRDDAIQVAERLLEAVSAPFDLDGQEVAVGASIGISLYPDDGADAATLVTNADMAMYRAKEAGKGVFCFFAGEMQQRAAARLRLDAALRHALERREFRVMFQPQVEAATGRLLGAEALLRWQHPELGEVGPDVFVPILEETGLIFPVGEWVLTEACRHWHSWSACGSGRLRMAVNVSGRQLHQARLPELVGRVLQTTGLKAACLELELTESVIMENAPATVATLKAVEALGVSLAVDDFGTGYSSLSYLKAFPIRALKIDRSFVRDITADESSRAIAGAVISLAHSLDLTVIAEGVETGAQLAVLQGLDCDLAQGYLFGRPMEADAFQRHLEEQAAPRRPDACLPGPP
jgi:diguanylate cyclase (GGDEF)-like protein